MSHGSYAIARFKRGQRRGLRHAQQAVHGQIGCAATWYRYRQYAELGYIDTKLVKFVLKTHRICTNLIGSNGICRVFHDMALLYRERTQSYIMLLKLSDGVGPSVRPS